MKINILSAVACLLVVTVAYSDVTEENVQKLHNGMTYKEVAAIFGVEGYYTEGNEHLGITYYSFAGPTSAQIVTCKFKKGHLIKVIDGIKK
ncbi:MAG: hypothetical protein ABI925_09685 [Verrucomicrobiota bacterium]